MISTPSICIIHFTFNQELLFFCCCFRSVSSEMCPLRLILVFFSAVLAGYFAWKTVGSSSSSQESESITVSNQFSSSHAELLTSASRERQEFSYLKMIQNGFWVFVDMASGSYLWRNLKGIREAQTITEKKLAS